MLNLFLLLDMGFSDITHRLKTPNIMWFLWPTLLLYLSFVVFGLVG